MKKNIIFISLFFISQYINSQDIIKLSLSEAIDFAIKNNYDNQRANKDIEIAKAVKWETTATGLPQIDGTVDYKNWLKQNVMLLPAQMMGGKAGEFVPVSFGTKQTMNASVTLKQLIFSGSYLVGLQSAKTYLKISQQAKKKTQFATREAIINAYGNVLMATKSCELLEKNKVNLQKNLAESKEIYKNGFIEQESVEQLKITLGMINNNLRNAKRLEIIAKQMLNIALGNKTNSKLELTDSLEHLTKNIDFNLIATNFNITKNIDYNIAKTDLKAKELLWKLEKTKYLPTLSAFVNYSANANSNKFTFFDKEQNWYKSSLLGINLTVPIFSSFGRSSKLKQARLELEKTEIQLKEIEQKLTLQAQSAKSEYQLSIENLATAKQNLKLAERIEEKNQIKFKEGIASSFDLLQAQNQLYTQQNNYIKAMLEVITKKASLERLLNIE